MIEPKQYLPRYTETKPKDAERLISDGWIFAGSLPNVKVVRQRRDKMGFETTVEMD